MSDFTPGLEGVVAFETQIAEPDKEGGALRYRGVDIEELVGHVTYGHVWGLLVDNAFEPGLPPAEPYPIPVHSGDIRVDVQSALAMLAPAWGMQQLLDISDEQARDDLARASVMALSFVAQAARGIGLPMVPQRRVDEARTITERFMIRWRGDPDPKHVKAIDAYWVSAAEHGMNASTFTARVIASTGPRILAPAYCAGPRVISALRGTRLRRPWRRQPSTSYTHGGRIGSWPRTSSSGRRSCSTSPGSRRTCSPRCSRVRARRAGRRTYSSRSRPAGWSGPAPGTSARQPGRSATCQAAQTSSTATSDWAPLLIGHRVIA